MERPFKIARPMFDLDPDTQAVEVPQRAVEVRDASTQTVVGPTRGTYKIFASAESMPQYISPPEIYLFEKILKAQQRRRSSSAPATTPNPATRSPEASR